MPIPEWILFAVFFAAATFLVGYIGDRAPARRASALASGEIVAVPARVRGSHEPYSLGYRRGRVVIEHGSVFWAPRRGDRVDLGMMGLRAQWVDDDDRNVAHWFEADQFFTYMTVRAYDDGGRQVFVRARGQDVSTIVRALRRQRSVPKAHPVAAPAMEPATMTESTMSRPWAAIVCAVIATLVTAIAVLLVTTGASVEATVTAVDAANGGSDITFTDPWSGESRSTSVTWQENDEIGGVVTVLAPRYVLRGDAAYREDFFIVAAVIAIPLVLCALFFWWRGRRAGRVPLAATPPREFVDEGALASPPEGSDASFEAVLAYVSARARAEQWSVGTLADLDSAPVHPTPLSTLGRFAAAKAVGPWVLLPLAFAGLMAFPAVSASADLWFHRSGSVEQVSARVDSVDRFLLFRTAFLEVEGRTGEYLLNAPVTSEVQPGDTVTALIPVDAPAHVRIQGADATVTHAVLAWPLVVIFLAATVGYAWWRLKQYRDPMRAAQEPAQRMRYVRSKDFSSDDVLLLFDERGSAPPRYAVSLLSGDPDLLPLAGTTDVHGVLADGNCVAPEIQGRFFWPGLWPARKVEPSDVGDFLDGASWVLDDEIQDPPSGDGTDERH